MRNAIRLMIVAAMLQGAGCATVREWIDEHCKPKPETEFPEGLVWLHTDVSAWPATATLYSVTFSGCGEFITLDYDKARSWPAHDYGDMQCNANPWIIVEHQGRWFAGTWEWMKRGQTQKFKSAVNGDHIQRRELDDWSPVPGETYGFMLSGLARSHVRTVQERSNVVWITWPE